jgi:DNA-binding beta-propeller fold protein YncE
MSSPVARLAITPDGRTVYAPDARSVVPINAMTGRAGKPIRVGYTPELIVMAPDGKTAYAAGSSPSLTPINTATNQAGRPFGIEPAGSFPAAIATTPDGKTGSSKLTGVVFSSGYLT